MCCSSCGHRVRQDLGLNNSNDTFDCLSSVDFFLLDTTYQLVKIVHALITNINKPLFIVHEAIERKICLLVVPSIHQKLAGNSAYHNLKEIRLTKVQFSNVLP